jgi:hypothetical protein
MAATRSDKQLHSLAIISTTRISNASVLVVATGRARSPSCRRGCHPAGWGEKSTSVRALVIRTRVCPRKYLGAIFFGLHGVLEVLLFCCVAVCASERRTTPRVAPSINGRVCDVSASPPLPSDRGFDDRSHQI